MSTELDLLDYKVKKLEEWQTSVKVTIDEMERVCDIVTQNKKYIQDLNIMQKELSEIKEKNTWIFRLVIASIITGILIPIVIKYLG